MALRNLARQISPFAASWARCSSSTPTVFDKMVQIFVIDSHGVRHTVRGLEGETLADTLAQSGQFGGDAFMPHVYATGNIDCHVYVQGDYLDKLNQLTPEQQKEQAGLIDYYVRARARDNSRMGYYIKLSPQLNGMTVALGELELWATP